MRSFQGVRQGGRSAHPAGQGSGFRGQQPHDRQVGFNGAPQEGHHAYPVGPSSGYPNRQVGFHGTPQEGHHAYPVGPSNGYPNRQVGFHGTPQEGHHAYPVGPSSGHSGMQSWGYEFQGVSRQRARPYKRPVIGGVGGGYQDQDQRGPYGSGGPRVGPNYGNRGGSGSGAAAALRPAGGSGAVTSTSGAISYAGAVVQGQGTVGSRGVAGRGSAATGPTGAPGRGAGRGVTIAQSPAQLAHAAAQRDARKPGQGKAAVVGGRSSGRSGSKNECIIPGCEFTCGGGHKRHAVNAHLPKLFWEISGSTSLPDGQMAQLN